MTKQYNIMCLCMLTVYLKKKEIIEKKRNKYAINNWVEIKKKGYGQTRDNQEK